ncbi:MAG: flagellar hook-associated protein FlgL [Pseudomonadota bacterium]
MRISTNSMYAAGSSQLNTLQSNIAKTQMQLSTNRRMLSAADDPIASARALEVTQSQSVNAQYAVNRQNARSSLTMVEQSLGNVTKTIQDVQELVVRAGSGALSPADRVTLANEAQGHLETMMGQANASDSEGYLFAGFKSKTAPFVQTATGAQYLGDQGERKLQVASARNFSISTPGSAVFENNMTGNGTFVTSATTTNNGSGVVSGGAVANPAAVTGHDYDITFSGVAPTSTFTVLDKVTNLPPPGLVGPQPFVSGQQIAFDGITLDIRGAPLNGDSFAIDPSERQSVFTTLTDLIATLRAPPNGEPGKVAMTNGLAKASSNMASALDNVLSEQASAGAKLKELDELDSTGEDLNIQYADTLSKLQDLDLVATISKFTQQQFTLEAAQKSFKSLSGLSLFNYIG